jgi:hypothetical protein
MKLQVKRGLAPANFLDIKERGQARLPDLRDIRSGIPTDSSACYYGAWPYKTAQRRCLRINVAIFQASIAFQGSEAIV